MRCLCTRKMIKMFLIIQNYSHSPRIKTLSIDSYIGLIYIIYDTNFRDFYTIRETLKRQSEKILSADQGT